MDNTPTIYDGERALATPNDLRQQVNAIQYAIKAVMQKDVHYGVIPGTQKPTLYKPGSEVLLTMFHIAVDPQAEELREGIDIRYRVRAVGRHQASGIVVGVGIGEASTAEDKYAWRRAICPEEWNDTDPTRRRTKYQKYKGQIEKVQQVRTNPADIANTVLKMAKKRAQIDLTLTATAASDCFTQDVEDLPEELRDDERGRSGGAGLTPEQVEGLKSAMNTAKDRAQLRKLLQAAMKAAQEAGDAEAHSAVKAYATTLSANLPEGPQEPGEPAEATP